MDAPDGMSHTEINFSKAFSRLCATLEEQGIPTGVLQVSEFYDTFWAVVTIRRYHLFKVPYNFARSIVAFSKDMYGRLWCEDFRKGNKRNDKEGKHVAQSDTSEVDKQPNIPKRDVSSLGYVRARNTENVNPPVQFSRLRELNWDQNKANWQGILKVEKQSIDECISTCDIWQPSCPMQLTPDRESLRCLFSSETDFCKAMRKIETERPGFAIASRSWASLIDVDDLPVQPAHICDILTVARENEQNDIRLWIFVSHSRKQIIAKQIQYMLLLGRTIKHCLAKQDYQCPNLSIQCTLFSTDQQSNDLIEETLQQLRITMTQNLLKPMFNENGKFELLRRSIALLVLSKESIIKTCVGNQMSLKLSAKQAQVLLKHTRVNCIAGPPGSGKTLCGWSVYREFGRKESVYICPSQSLIGYLRHNGCDAILVENDHDLSQHIDRGTFENKKCVVINESHHLKCTRASLKKLFLVLKRNQNMRLFVFADNEYQRFDGESGQHIVDHIFELSRKFLNETPRVDCFTEIYRNTRKVVSFLQHAIKDTLNSAEDIICASRDDGDGIQCIAMRSLFENNPDNELVQYLRPFLGFGPLEDAKYQHTDVVVLLDSGYPSSQVDKIRRILQTQFPGITTQTSEKFPRRGIVVDKVETFLGLDAPFCIFLMYSDKETTLGYSV